MAVKKQHGGFLASGTCQKYCFESLDITHLHEVACSRIKKKSRFCSYDD